MLSDADQATVRGNDVRGNGYGIALFSGTGGAIVRANEVVSNADAGVYVEHSRGNLIAGNEIEGSAGAGVAMIGGGDHVVSENVLTLNAEGVSVGEELLPSDGNRVEHNTIEASNGAGLVVVDSSGTVLAYNEVRESNGAGAELDLARDSVVRGNDLRGNAGGIALSESTGSLIEFNDAGGARGTGHRARERIQRQRDRRQRLQRLQRRGHRGRRLRRRRAEQPDRAQPRRRQRRRRHRRDRRRPHAHRQPRVAQRRLGHLRARGRGRRRRQRRGRQRRARPVRGRGLRARRGARGAGDAHHRRAAGAVRTAATPSFTYFGSDDVTPIAELVFECSLDGGAWEDCEYPHEVMNLAAGRARARDPRRRPQRARRPDTRPARVGVRPAAGQRPARGLRGPRPGGRDVVAGRAVHVPLRRARRDLRVPRRHAPVRAVRLRGRGVHVARRLRVGAGGDRGRRAHVPRARDRLRGQRRPRRRCYRWSLLGVATAFLSGPGFTPGTSGEPASGGESASSDATIDFIANVADATYECSLDLAPFTPCAPPVSYTGLGLGDHELRVVATDPEGVTELEAAVYEWEVIEVTDTVAPDTSIERAPATGTSSTLFEFTGSDNLATAAQLDYECRIDSTNALDWEACESPYNLLDHYTYGDLQLAPGPHVFEVRAVDEFDNADPSPARHEWTIGAGRLGAGHRVRERPDGQGRRGRRDVRVQRRRQRDARALARVRVLARRRCVRGMHVAARPDGRAGRARAARARGRPGRQRRRHARGPGVGARRAAGGVDPVRPERRRRERARDLHVLGRPAGRDVRVLDRRRDVRAVHVAARRVGRRGRRPPLRGPRRQRRRRRSSPTRPRSTSGRPCSAPTPRGRTPRSRPARCPRRRS